MRVPEPSLRQVQSAMAVLAYYASLTMSDSADDEANPATTLCRAIQLLEVVERTRKAGASTTAIGEAMGRRAGA